MVRTATKLPAMTEKDFQREVVKLAKMFGWKYHHQTLSWASGAGWPDLSLVRGDRLVFAELKTERGAVTANQQEWLDALRGTGRCEVYVWRPSDLERIVEILR